MADRCRLGLLAVLAVLVLASSASATTVGQVQGRPAAGRPLELNIPFVLDQPRDRACASADLRYGNAPIPNKTLHVQGHGLRRNLLVTSQAKVTARPVTIDVRLGCGAKAVTRRFILPASIQAARLSTVPEPRTRHLASRLRPSPARRPVLMMARGESLFPPPAPEAIPTENRAGKDDAPTAEALRTARTEAADAMAQLAAAREELAAVVDVERRTSQTLVDAEHRVADAQSEADRMRFVLKWTAAGLALAVAGLGWWEFHRLGLRRRPSAGHGAQEQSLFVDVEEAPA